MNAVTISNVTKMYGSQKALDSISCTIRAGSITALLGPNGAGKSTLMRIICGLESPTTGTVELQDLQQGADSDLIYRGALLSPEWLDERLNCRDTLHYHMLLADVAYSAAEVDRILAFVGLSDAATKKVKDLSLGMRQRLAMGIALLGNPRLLVLDEPVNGLDPQGVRWVREVLHNLAGQGTTILISSHLISEVSLIANEVIVLDTGALKFSGPVSVLDAPKTSSLVQVRLQDQGVHKDLACAVTAAGAHCDAPDADGQITISGLSSADVFTLASQNGIVLTHLEQLSRSLEDAYFDLVGGQTYGQAR